jgi:hypothetical protein
MWQCANVLIYELVLRESEMLYKNLFFYTHLVFLPLTNYQINALSHYILSTLIATLISSVRSSISELCNNLSEMVSDSASVSEQI